MNEITEQLRTLVTGDSLWNVVRAVAILVGGVLLARVAGVALARALSALQTPQQGALTRRVTAWTVFGLAAVTALHELGFDLTALLGAAGVLTVAVGFAAQTSASNMISGLFLSGERGFVVGAAIRLGDTTGEILSIDLLSVKLRTFDNLFVRIPNETLIKSQITILNHFPVRRVDLSIGGAYHDDLARIERVLRAAADKNPLCLEEPPPLFMVLGFGDNAVNLQFSVWAHRDAFLEMRTSLLSDIKRAFDAEGLTFPFPQRQLHVSAASALAPHPKEPARAAS